MGTYASFFLFGGEYPGEDVIPRLFTLHVLLIPALVPLGIVLTGAALWPWLERWATGDHRFHHINERPRNAPVRTSLGVGTVAFYGTLWLAGANDVIAEKFDVSLYATTWFFRFGVFLIPLVTYLITKRICVGLQRADSATMAHGYESGILTMQPSGEFIEVHRKAPENQAIVLLSQEKGRPLPPVTDENGIPAATGPVGHAKARINRFWYADSVPVEEGRGHDDHAKVEGGTG